ncbi:MAG: TadE/TadG family type IV pilus assembly protein [Pirellulaceae bacterium]|nr:TadE/TadG family type IV pilus assembly protein [Pirellulaceae bacterium]
MRYLTNMDQSKRCGVATVEFASIAGLLFLLIASCFEFSRFVMLRQSADTAAYETARALIVPGAKVSDGNALAAQLLRNASVRNFTIEIEPTTIDESTSEVMVRTNVPIDSNSWISTFFTRGRVLTSEIRLLTERNPIEQAKAASVPPPPPSDPPSPPPVSV